MALTRGVDAAMIAILAGHFHPVLLTEADAPSGILRAHTNKGTLVYDGHDWSGFAPYAMWSFPDEGGGLTTAEAEVHLALSVEGMLALRGENMRNRAVRVLLGAVTEAGGNVLRAPPVEMFAGGFDSRRVSIARDASDDLQHDMALGVGVGPSARAGASIEHGAEDQARAFPGDTAGRHVINALKQAANPPKW